MKAARECYKIYQNEKQKSKAKNDKDLKWKIITEETEMVCMKIHPFQSSIDELVKDTDELAIAAQETQVDWIMNGWRNLWFSAKILLYEQIHK